MTRRVGLGVRVAEVCAVALFVLIATSGWSSRGLADNSADNSLAAAPPAGTAPAVNAPPAQTIPPAPASSETPAVSPAAGPAPSIEPIPQNGNGQGGDGVGNLPHNLSPWNMFLAADIVVKGVMIGLALASLVTWTVWITKSVELMVSRRRLGGDATLIAGALSLDEARHRLNRQRGPAARFIAAATHELALSADVHDKSAIGDRVRSRLDDAVAAAGRQINTGTGLLATIGSTAPFVGLFGTVWGIMNSFISISQSQTTNLAIVAPGIAEALLATAIGLVAAIPAVIVYNQFARAIAGYKASLAEVSSEIQRFVSRDLDRAHRGVLVRAAE